MMCCVRPASHQPEQVWDFSSENAIQQLQLPRKWHSVGPNREGVEFYNLDQKVKILLPEGRVLDRKIEALSIAKGTRGVTAQVVVGFGPQNISNACSLAKELARVWNLPTAKFDEALKNGGGPMGVADAVEVFNPKQIDPSVEIRLGPSSDEGRPFWVQLIITWFDPTSRQWLHNAAAGTQPSPTTHPERALRRSWHQILKH
jgi:hypothetical protein